MLILVTGPVWNLFLPDGMLCMQFCLFANVLLFSDAVGLSRRYHHGRLGLRESPLFSTESDGIREVLEVFPVAIVGVGGDDRILLYWLAW